MTPWTVARQAPLSVAFSRQEYWSGLPLPIPGDLPDPGIETASLTSPALAGGFRYRYRHQGSPYVCMRACRYLQGKASIFVNYRLQSRKIGYTGGKRPLAP